MPVGVGVYTTGFNTPVQMESPFQRREKNGTDQEIPEMFVDFFWEQKLFPKPFADAAYR